MRVAPSVSAGAAQFAASLRIGLACTLRCTSDNNPSLAVQKCKLSARLASQLGRPFSLLISTRDGPDGWWGINDDRNDDNGADGLLHESAPPP